MAKCPKCQKIFSTGSTLNRHKRNIHGEKNKFETSKLICPSEECNQQFNTRHVLREHLKISHGVNSSSEEFVFESEEDFELWRYQIQNETSSEYVKGTSTKVKPDGCKKTYLHCNRSDKYRSKRKGDGLRTMKSMGSRKVGKTCPSTIEVTKRLSGNGVKIKVKFWKDHFGHTCNLGHTTIPKRDRDEIARKLKSGVTVDGVLEAVRRPVTDEEFSWSKRTLLMERKDLHNIVQQYNITYSTKRHKDDGLSVKMWIDEIKQTEENPILFFKEQGQQSAHLKIEDFALVIMTEFQKEQILKFGMNKICIDGTHGTNAYDILLHTLLTVDEFGSGVPVAYLFSNRSDEPTFRMFFEQVKEKVGTINCSVFMSDDAPAMYNAWSSVMGQVKNRLLCTWHVDRCWQKNLSKIKGNEKKKEVYKTLRTLLQLTTEEEEFKDLLSKTAARLLEDVDTKSFGEYFMKCYVSRPESWAYFYRKGLGINTNMYLESFHKSLKHIYLEGKKVKRMDKTIHALMRFTRDCMFKRLIKLNKNTSSEKMQKVNKSHRESVNVKEIKTVKENEWLVVSSSSDLTYSVSKVGDVCTNRCIKCTMCNICVHTYQCTCMDNVIKLNICKHIHACHKLLYCKTSSECPTSRQEEATQCEVERLFELTRSEGRLYSPKERLEGKLKLALDLLGNAPENVIHDKATSIEKSLDSILSDLNEIPERLRIKENVNTTAKIDQQVRLFSTKKKRRQNSFYKKPTANQCKNIIDGLNNTSKESINVHTGFDHSYCYLNQ